MGARADRAPRPREAVDLLVKRLAHRLERISHDDGAGERRTPRDGPAGPGPDREIVRHFTVSPMPCSVDAASGQDAVVYRSGGTGLRLSRADGSIGRAESEADAMRVSSVTVNLVTVSSQPAPRLDTTEAVRRLGLTGLTFLFYVDANHGRANVLYHRADGAYGLIDPVNDRTYR